MWHSYLTYSSHFSTPQSAKGYFCGRRRRWAVCLLPWILQGPWPQGIFWGQPRHAVRHPFVRCAALGPHHQWRWPRGEGALRRPRAATRSPAHASRDQDVYVRRRQGHTSQIGVTGTPVCQRRTSSDGEVCVAKGVRRLLAPRPPVPPQRSLQWRRELWGEELVPGVEGACVHDVHWRRFGEGTSHSQRTGDPWSGVSVVQRSVWLQVRRVHAVACATILEAPLLWPQGRSVGTPIGLLLNPTFSQDVTVHGVTMCALILDFVFR